MQNIIKINIDQIKQIMQDHGVVSAFVFGSVLSGNMSADSDVDFIVSFNPAMGYEEYGNNYFELMYALQDLFKREVDLVAEETITNPYLLQSINSNKLQVL